MYEYEQTLEPLPDIHGADLRGAQLKGAKLIGANLVGAKLAKHFSVYRVSL